MPSFPPSVPVLHLVSQGKVRDMYEVDADTLLILTTDRMSAFDVVLPTAIPHKGCVLNQLTLFWMDRFKNIVPHHIITGDINAYPTVLQPYASILLGRSVLVKKARPLPVECIVRGYLAGSAWKEYQKTGSVCGIALPVGLKENQILPEPLFTPSTKAVDDAHDENISKGQAAGLLGPALAEKVEGISLALYLGAREYAAKRGVIIADTKFEFGIVDGELTLIDEALTPDSSRFWPADTYEAAFQAGTAQPSFDKQYLRDWLETQNWDKKAPGPVLPPDVVQTTSNKYIEAFERITGHPPILG